MKLRYLFPLLCVCLLAHLANAAPTITSFTPTYGASSDTGFISISGSGFTGGALVVKYGGVSGVQDTTAVATQDNLIQSRVPAGAQSGQIYVSVGGSGVLSSGSFTVIGSGPYIASFSPSGGAAGTSVTLTGAHFTSGSGGTAVVKFNGKAGTVTLSGDTSLTATVPAGATTGFITVERSGMTTGTSSTPFYINPVITGFSPVNGRSGTNVVIQGTNFTGAVSVWFNGTSVSNLTGVTSNQITVAVPAGATTGPLYVYTPAPNPAFTTSNFVVLPLITGFSPTKGTIGTSVTLTGENLWGATNVLFGGVKAAAPTGISYSQLTAVVPNGATNGFITVQTTNGSYTINQLFYLPPQVTSFTPTNGASGTSVQINGTNFLGATAVTFNGAPATSFVVTNNGVIGAIVPSGVITGPIYVTTPYGTTNSATNVVFYGAPVITGFNPTSGLPGTNVTIFGTNFAGATAVSFNGTAASFNVTNGILTAIVPTNASTGPITVVGPSGTNQSAASFVLNYASDLSVTVSAQTSVLLGNNFTYVITVTNKGPSAAPNVFLTNNLPATVQLQSGSSISPSSGRSFLSLGNPVIASLGTIAVSNAVTVTLIVKPQVTGSITDNASVISDFADPVSGNNSGSASTTVYVVPVLAIQNLSATSVQLSWSVTLSDYVLQSSTNLSDTNAWSDVQTPPDFVGDQKVVTETIGAGGRFYRLKQQ